MRVDTSLLYPKTPPSSTIPIEHITDNLSGNMMSGTTGNTTENITCCNAPAPSAFFSAVPTDQILALTGSHRIKRPDAMLLLALLSHKRQPHGTEVRPHQGRLAALMACCIRTVQRGLDRLEAAGLIVRRYQRDRRGRVHGLRYDLAGTLALLPPTKATHASPGHAPRPAGVSAPPASQTGPDPAPAPKRHKGHAESESCDAEINNSADSPPTPPVPAVVQTLMGVGVIGRIAARLFARCGEARCHQALAAAARRKGITNTPAWIYRCLTEGWDLPRAGSSRPQSQHRYTPPAVPVATPGGDALAPLAPAVFAALEHAARAQLIAETPVLRPILEKGRRTPTLLARMRELLAAGAGDLAGAEA